MESPNKNTNSNTKYIFILIALIVLVGIGIFLSRGGSSDENTGQEANTEAGTENKETEPEVVTEPEKAKDPSENPINSVENTEEFRAEINEIINYDFSKYDIIGEDAEKYTRTFNALDTVIQIIIYSDDSSLDVEKIMDETEVLVDDYENLMSKTVPGSFTNSLNANGEFDYSNFAYADVVHQITEKSKKYEELSGGVLDVTMEPVVRLWNINNGNTEVPAQEDIDAALSLVGYENFVRDETSQKYVLLNGSTVDFGAIAKGHVADVVKGSLMSKGIDSALVNFGGNVMTIGAKPGDKVWVIGIQDPQNDTGAMLGTIDVKNKTVVTSGNYERFFIKDGVRYHHILDPKTGYPGNSGLVQSTIVSDRSIDCDALSTTTFLLGAVDGTELVEGLDGFEAMFINEDMEYTFTSGFNAQYRFTPMEQ